MELIKNCIDIFFHIDVHLNAVIQNFGVWSYVLLFVIIFAETGLVITPFLPGDSLLFAAGTLAAAGSFKLSWLVGTLTLAAIVGDSVNYAVGKIFGEAIFHRGHSRIFKKAYMDRTHQFFEKYGGKTIILARFVPVVRTFAPFVAGVGKMTYLHFFSYNVIGGILWVVVFVLGGYYFGGMPIIKNNFSLTIFVIIFISILPGIIEVIKHKKRKRRALASKKS